MQVFSSEFLRTFSKHLWATVLECSTMTLLYFGSSHDGYPVIQVIVNKTPSLVVFCCIIFYFELLLGGKKNLEKQSFSQISTNFLIN